MGGRTGAGSRIRGRTVLVTGGSDGVGREIVRGLVALGAHVLMPVRDRAKGLRVRADLLGSLPPAALEQSRARRSDVSGVSGQQPGVTLMDLDLESLASVRTLAVELLGADAPLDALVLNAGIVPMGEGPRRLTEDGIERTLQTSFLGHFALTTALVPLLRQSRGQVVVQCSAATARGRIDLADLQSAHAYRPFAAYRTSKQALGVFAAELSRRSAAGGWGVRVRACHPGMVLGTAIAPRVRARLPQRLIRLAERLGNTPAEAASTALAAVESPRRGFRMFVPGGPLELRGSPRERAPWPSLLDAAQGCELWREAELLGYSRITRSRGLR
ncbi:SDR family NAD(P)-dependent oxidoreductase [Brevibacterium sp.]|uniref:SDR family NAD(P)-dependent oxidoreductase n=1 Tax=Brevibacterium sp. TaxID=1701 RepID=UPI0025C726DD|nr:SDR family NAD(P)-dependent oxidoreductase [Brevibacterium sp.]